MSDAEIPAERIFPVRDVEAAHRRAREAHRQFLIDSVWNDMMLPSEAEESAAGTGLLFDGSDGPVTLDSPKWSLAQAVVWVAWCDPNRIQQQWWRLHAWSGSLWRDPPSERQLRTFEQAEIALWEQLEAGRVHAIGLPGYASKPVQIDSLDWSNLVWMPEKARLSVRYFGQPDPAYRCVDVKSTDMLTVWPALGLQALKTPSKTAEPQASVTPRRRGPPAVKTENVMANMYAAIASGKHSHRSLKAAIEESLVSEFGTTRYTCRTARNRILSEMLD